MIFKRLLPALLCLLLALSPIAACAQTDLQGCSEGIYAYVCGENGLQAWIDAEVAANAGSAADNYIINLSRTKHDLDLSGYVRSAAKRLQDGDITNPVSRMRCALALISVGAVEHVPDDLADESIGKLGVMSYIFGLHLLNNGAASQLWTADSLVEKLLQMQKEDGGWAVMGAYGDVDVTAMCLQALSCYDRADEIRDEIDRGLELLSQRQLDSAGFSSNGRENGESAAQVLIALASLGINPLDDARFIKSGKTVLDALMEYRRASGGFAHLPGEDENETACVQALQAFTALQQLGVGYFDFASPVTVDAPLEEESPSLPSWKLYALIALAVLLVAGSIFALTRRHGRVKQLVFVLMLVAIGCALVLTLNIETAGDYYSADTSAETDGTVYLSIRCDTVAGAAADGSTPDDGVILPRTEMAIRSGDTVFDVLTGAARSFKLHLEHEGGTGDMAYINAINHLYEYVYGELSGWVYTVNGEQPSIGCGAYGVSDGDEIIWHYTLNLGEDIK